MKIEIQIIKPNSLPHNTRLCRLNPERPPIPDRIQLNQCNPKAHLCMEHTRQGLEVGQQNQEDQSTDIFANDRDQGSNVLEVEGD